MIQRLVTNLSFFLLISLGFSATAQNLEFDDLSQEDLEDVMEEFSANFHHTSVSGAGSLGRLFGFEIGLIGGISKTPRIDALVKEQDASKDAEQIPHGRILGALTVPFGITAELGFVPKVGGEDFKFDTYSLAAKWTVTDVFLTDLPVSLGVKGHLTQVNLDFKQPVSGVDTDVSVEDTITGLQFLVSKNFLIVEPYAGIGYLMADGKIDVAGSSTIFDFTTSQSASTDSSGMQFLVGAELKLLVFKAGIEYSKQFDTDRYSMKLAVYF
jgi:hypothetical protein